MNNKRHKSTSRLSLLLAIVALGTGALSSAKNEAIAGTPYSLFPDKVVVTRVMHFENWCWKIAAGNGTWYFETGETDGKTGFSSAFDHAGNDWIGNDADKGYNLSPRGTGKHEYRGWPNFGNGNFDHPQRPSGSSTRWVDENGEDLAFDAQGMLKGEHLRMRSANETYELEYHFFPSHIAIKVLRADDAYAFLFEGPIGGEMEGPEVDKWVFKDGTENGQLCSLTECFSPFIYFLDTDPKDTQVLYIGATNLPEGIGGESYVQKDNMVVVSYGRVGTWPNDNRSLTGTDPVAVFGFHDKEGHKEISRFIEQRLVEPFSPVGPPNQAAHAERELWFNIWLRDYIAATYPDVEVKDNRDWFQAAIPEQDLVVNWAFLPQDRYTMKGVVGLYEDKHLFISSSVPRKDWESAADIRYFDGIGYEVPAYDADTVGAFEVAKRTVVQFDGDGSQFLADMQAAWEGRESLLADPGYKPRVVNTTDLGADPDDKQSLVRQLVMANAFDIEGLVVSTGCWRKNQRNTDMLDEIVDAYGEAYPNLDVHADGFPAPEYLRSISVMGQLGYGMGDVGEGKDSPGSDMIIAAVDKDDQRPVWVMGWGGMNIAAQAIWKARETRTPTEFQEFLSKLRLFDILGQDDAGAWIAKNFPEVFYIRATGVYGWAPSDEHLAEHIQSHGPLGAVYPERKYATEGDTPAFMHVYPNGLNDPEAVGQGGWGGRFETEKKAGIRSMSEVAKIDSDAEPSYDPYYMYGNTPKGGQSIKRWETEYNNDFAARMDWSITSDYEDANHHPVAILNGDRSKRIIELSARAGSELSLSAEGSSDPDGDGLSYEWSYYEEPSSFDGPVDIRNGSSRVATVRIPQDAVGDDLHIILKVYDDGAPNLYAYRRAIVKVSE
ncbi:nucleoside hydrolase-like domain-containing protein [Pelagicoccus sp. SDUM812002]|uniref:DUF1593 domain-containing protein n=1 Tax=Pelagicoccus sp. SDUM812002 TaxID=3041266 RepID=UPI00280D984B|nr:nucleoside hydrolase-like domain-containing protein [Pelagicoccus sp. SDUM812002]MDQ8187649.1 DUF1593 domain-containing protein [Pelagicoccus sp. SDUM812002]